MRCFFSATVNNSNGTIRIINIMTFIVPSVYQTKSTHRKPLTLELAIWLINFFPPSRNIAFRLLCYVWMTRNLTEFTPVYWLDVSSEYVQHAVIIRVRHTKVSGSQARTRRGVAGVKNLGSRSPIRQSPWWPDPKNLLLTRETFLVWTYLFIIWNHFFSRMLQKACIILC